MKTNTARILLVLLGAALLPGCGLAHNQVLFGTKSNIGLDVDSKPPTFQLNIHRGEINFAPAFDGGQTPPVSASFRSKARGVSGLFVDVASTFAGGDAAATMTDLFGDPDSKTASDSTLCLAAEPSRWGGKLTLPGPTDIRPFLFGTDTSIGLKVAWSGLTAQFPDTVRLGYNRKEMAWAPVYIRHEACTVTVPFGASASGASGSSASTASSTAAATLTGTHKVKVPSFLATIDVVARVGAPQETGTEYIQYFATGVAATNLARRQQVRKTMLTRLDPGTPVVSKFEPDANSECIRKWREADRTNVERLNSWMRTNGIPGVGTDLVFGGEYAAARVRAIKELKIPCP